MELDHEHMATVYDPAGVAHRVSRLDAVEYLASGHYTSTSPLKVPEHGKVDVAQVKPEAHAAAKPEVAAAYKADRKA